MAAARATPSVLDRLVWCGRAARLALEDPVEGLDRALLRVVHRRGESLRTVEPETAWEPRLHALLDAPWPCAECEGFDGVYSTTSEELGGQGLLVGRGAFGGWGAAEPAFERGGGARPRVRVRSRKVLHAGAPRGGPAGITPEARRHPEAGRLWSSPPPPLDADLHDQIGVAVPAHLRERWTLLRGTSRRVLPGL